MEREVQWGRGGVVGDGGRCQWILCEGHVIIDCVLDVTVVAHAEERPHAQRGGRTGGIGSRRRAGTETPTDSNAMEGKTRGERSGRAIYRNRWKAERSGPGEGGGT